MRCRGMWMHSCKSARLGQGSDASSYYAKFLGVVGVFLVGLERVRTSGSAVVFTTTPAPIYAAQKI